MSQESASPAVAVGPSSDDLEAVIASIWEKRAEWSNAASRFKRNLARSRAAAVLLGLAGTALETSAATLLSQMEGMRTICAGAGAVLLAFAAFVSAKLVTPDAVRRWVRARSVSEAIKAEVYTFRAGADPYAGPDAPRLLHERVSKIQHDAGDLLPHLEEVKARNDPPPPLSRDEYIQRRIRNIIGNYYRPVATRMRKRVKWFRSAEIGLGGIAAGLGGFVTFASERLPAQAQLTTTLGAWVAVITGVTATIGAHIAANRWDFVVASYAATAARLQEVLEAWRLEGSPANPARWSAFVRDCENAISSQNAAWMAKQTEQTTT